MEHIEVVEQTGNSWLREIRNFGFPKCAGRLGPSGSTIAGDRVFPREFRLAVIQVKGVNVNLVEARRSARGLFFAAAVVAGMVAGPAAHAESKEVPVGASGQFETQVPATPGATLTLTVNGKSHTVGVPATTGGTLSLGFSANTAAKVSLDVTTCPAPAAGKVITVSGFAEGTKVTAGFASPATGPVTTGTDTVSKGGTVTASLCAAVS